MKELIKIYTKENDNSKSLNNIISYLMTLIYDKIFPCIQSEEDLKFEEICKNLNNININNLIKNDNNILNDDFLDEGFTYIQNLEIEKCAFRKFKLFVYLDHYIQKVINQYIKNTSNENIINIKIYIIIKSLPKQFISNIKYIKGFIKMNDLTLGEKEILSEIDILTNKCLIFSNTDENIINKI